MGGRPLIAINLVGWNTEELPPICWPMFCSVPVTSLPRAGSSVVGGHTVDDPEPKFGLAVVGEAHPDRG